MTVVASQITHHWTVCPTVYSGWHQKKHQRSASLAFVRGIHRSPVDSPHKGPFMRKAVPCDGVFTKRSPSSTVRLRAIVICRSKFHRQIPFHYSDAIMGAMASQITSLTIVYSTVYSGADLRKHQSSASLDFVRGIHRWPVTGEFPAQTARNAENVSIGWRHHP